MTDAEAEAVIAKDGYDSQMGKWASNLQMKVTPSNNTTIKEVYAEISSDNNALMAALDAAGYTDGRITFYSGVSTLAETDEVSYFVVDDPATTAPNIVVKMSDPGMDALQNSYPGTHKVKVWTKDSDNRMKYTDLVIKSGGLTGCNIGSAGSGGSGSGDIVDDGKAPTIEWLEYNIDEEQELTAAGIDCTILAKSTDPKGFIKFEVDIISDVLTDEELSGVGLGSHIDLINPGDMKAPLQGLGFLPNRDSWEGENEATFTITDFMTILYGIHSNGKSEFKLTVADENGETTKSVKLVVNNK
jgi:hypothetical protein